MITSEDSIAVDLLKTECILPCPSDDLISQIASYRIFKVTDCVQEPVYEYNSKAWIASTQTFPARYSQIRVIYESELIKVKLCRDNYTDQLVAVKFIRKIRLSNHKTKTREERTNREVSIVKRLQHDYIIEFKEVIELADCVAIIMEHAANGELFDHVHRKHRLSEAETKKVMFEILLAVDYLHSNGIIHRDLKLENILLDAWNNVKIADFGFAIFGNDAGGIEVDKEPILKTSCGSPCYAAPEIVLNTAGYRGFPVDIWSCGVIMFALLFGHLPYEDQALAVVNQRLSPSRQMSSVNVHQLYRFISKNSLAIPNHVTPSSLAIDLLKGMLRFAPEKRYTLTEIFRHPWFANASCI